MTPNFSSNTSGNVFLYILIAVLLFGALSFTISKSSDSNPQGELSDAAAKTAVTSILAYEAQAKMAVNQMIQNGAKVDDIIFDMPSASTFNTGSTTLKLFHPDGGGLQYKTLPNKALPVSPIYSGYYIGRFNNWQWTPTSALDVLFTAYDVNKQVCEQLNLEIIGSKSIPNGGGRNFMIARDVFGNVYNNSNFLNGSCPSCVGKPSLCIYGSSSYQYYSILVGR